VEVGDLHKRLQLSTGDATNAKWLAGAKLTSQSADDLLNIALAPTLVEALARFVGTASQFVLQHPCAAQVACAELLCFKSN